MKIFEDESGETVNSILNHPEVRLRVVWGKEQSLDVRPYAGHPWARLLVGDPPHGTYFAIQMLEGVWAFHCGVLPQGRGEWSSEFAEAAIRYMFIHTNAIELMCGIPQGNLASLTMVRKYGFKPRWMRAATVLGKTVPYTVWSLTMQDWWPFYRNDHKACLHQMRQAGNELKAKNWELRYAFLSNVPLDVEPD